MADITPTDPIIKGAKIKLQATLKDSGGSGVTGQSTNLTFKVRNPSGTVESATGGSLTDEGAGVYSYKYTTAGAGKHYFSRTFDDGTEKKIEEDFFQVNDLLAA